MLGCDDRSLTRLFIVTQRRSFASSRSGTNEYKASRRRVYPDKGRAPQPDSIRKYN